VWDDDHAHAPALFLHGNTTGGNLEEEELKAAVELLISTHDPRYTQRVDELWPVVENNFEGNAVMAVRALPYMSEAYRKRLATRTRAYNEQLAATRRLC
jgi:hypothetical protein